MYIIIKRNRNRSSNCLVFIPFNVYKRIFTYAFSEHNEISHTIIVTSGEICFDGVDLYVTYSDLLLQLTRTESYHRTYTINTSKNVSYFVIVNLKLQTRLLYVES